jgi:hypothetical protein
VPSPLANSERGVRRGARIGAGIIVETGVGVERGVIIRNII